MPGWYRPSRFSKTSRWVVTGSDHIARIWDLEKGALIGRPFRVTAPVAVSPDNSRVASREKYSVRYRH
ncbi:hypothetical protein BDR06DRAFT_463819 [Suillus hirtellus]|nr:hypothetical protein BDR06DRAFT_463819 [Suillus hirtellus]